MHYSCGYFENNNMLLHDAQNAKCRHIENKLLIKPGQRVLDLGCGWGGFSCHLAARHDIEVVGITLSEQQLNTARQRAAALGLSNVRFELQDYREHKECYDRIVSIGMFEHVGMPYYDIYFEYLNSALGANGVGLIHSIGRAGPPDSTNPWIRKYIFPGGSIPSMSEMNQSAEKARFIQTDIEVLRLHYALTLRSWFERFQNNRDKIYEEKGESFCRMWEFYLSICEVAFQCSDLVVYQLQLAKQHSAVPLTRDYLYRERPARVIEQKWRSA